MHLENEIGQHYLFKIKYYIPFQGHTQLWAVLFSCQGNEMKKLLWSPVSSIRVKLDVRDVSGGLIWTQGICVSYVFQLPMIHIYVSSVKPVQFTSVPQSCPTLCDPMNRSTPGLPVHHQLPEFTQTHVHQLSDAIQPSHPLSSPSPPAPNPSQHQSLFQWVNSSHEVAKVLQFQL